MKTMNKAPT